MYHDKECSASHLTLLAVQRSSYCQLWGHFCSHSHFVYVWLSGMNYELTFGGRVTLRPPAGCIYKHSPHTTYCKQTRCTRSRPLLHNNIMLCKTKQETCETQTCASPLRCHLFLPIIQSDMSTCPTPISQALQAEICLCRGLVLTALLLITEFGERATPTHRLFGSFAQHAGTLLVEMWRTDAYSVAFLLQIHSHILLTSPLFSFSSQCVTLSTHIFTHFFKMYFIFSMNYNVTIPYMSILGSDVSGESESGKHCNIFDPPLSTQIHQHEKLDRNLKKH